MFWLPLWFIFMQKGCGIQKSQGIANKWHWQDWCHQARGPKSACLFILWNIPNSSDSLNPQSTIVCLGAQKFSPFFFFFKSFLSYFSSFIYFFWYAKGISFLFMINHLSHHSRFQMLKNHGALDWTEEFLFLKEFKTG